MVWAICGLIFAHFGGYCGSFCVCARVYEYSITYDYLFFAPLFDKALLRVFRGCFLMRGGILDVFFGVLLRCVAYLGWRERA